MGASYSGLFCIFYIFYILTSSDHSSLDKDTDLHVENWSCMFDLGEMCVVRTMFGHCSKWSVRAVRNMIQCSELQFMVLLNFKFDLCFRPFWKA